MLLFRTIVRNSDWHDPITFYSQTLEHNPTSGRLHNNLAMALAEAGKNNEAIIEYKRAISFEDFYPQTHYNLANAYIAVNNIDLAEKEYQNALKKDPYFIRAYVNLAKIYHARGERSKLSDLAKQLEAVSQKNQNFLPILKAIQL